MPGLSIRTSQAGEAMILALIGSATMLEVDQLTRETDRCAAARPKRLVVDLSQLDFLASLAIGQLLAMSKSVKLHGGTVVLAAAKPQIAAMLVRCNIASVIPMVASVDEAVRS
jgi:anti-anti-sigma factor